VNEQQLEERLERAADALPAPAFTRLGDLHARVRARRMRRRAVVLVAVIPVVLGIVAVADLLPGGLQRPVIEALGGDGGDGTPGQLELADDAIWISPVVADVTEAVRVFADVALGWEEPTIEVAAAAPGPVWIEIGGPRDRSIRALFAPTPAEGVWQALQIGGGVGWQGADPWTLAPDRPAPQATTMAEVYVRYGGRTWRIELVGDEELEQLRTTRDGLVRGIDLVAAGLPEDGWAASALIVYRDASGEVLQAAGGHFGIEFGDGSEPQPEPVDPGDLGMFDPGEEPEEAPTSEEAKDRMGDLAGVIGAELVAHQDRGLYDADLNGRIAASVGEAVVLLEGAQLRYSRTFARFAYRHPDGSWACAAIDQADDEIIDSTTGACPLGIDDAR
jgi:hypothetical protein